MIRQFYDGYGEHFRCADGSEYRYPPSVGSERKKEEAMCNKDTFIKKSNPVNDILSGFEADDLILVGLLLFLLYDGVNDYILLIILGIIFVTGLSDKEC